MRRITLVLCVTYFIVGMVGVATSQVRKDALTTAAESEAARLRESPEFARGGCDVNALVVGTTIARSREPALKVGDEIHSVNGQPVPDGDAFRAINELSSEQTLHLVLGRSGARVTVRIGCTSSAESIRLYILALDAAAVGNFVGCVQSLREYEQRFVRLSRVYGLWRRCATRAGQVKGESVWTTFVSYWTLRLQELKFKPDELELSRPTYLGALTTLSNAGQTFLLDEMQRQWAMASGESMYSAPSSRKETMPRPGEVPRASIVPRYSGGGSSCEDGHWIQEVLSAGALVRLEDGSLWKVDEVDTIDSALWLPITDIVVCDGTLVNTEDNESVSVVRVE